MSDFLDLFNEQMIPVLMEEFVETLLDEFLGSGISEDELLSKACRADLAALVRWHSSAHRENSSSSSKLHEVIKSGKEHAGILVRMLKFLGCADPNANSSEGKPITVACSQPCPCLYLIDQLLKLRADVDTPSGSGTPLAIASSNGQTRLVRRLLCRGANVEGLVANPEPTGDDGKVPHSKVVPGCPDKKTPLMLAIQNQHVEVMRILLGHKASLQKSDINGNSCFHLAALTGNPQIVDVVAEGGNRMGLSDLQCSGQSPVTIALFNHHYRALSRLLYFGAAVRIDDWAVAIRRRDLDAVRVLLFETTDEGSRADVKVLSAAVTADFVEMVELLLFGFTGFALKKSELDMLIREDARSSSVKTLLARRLLEQDNEGKLRTAEVKQEVNGEAADHRRQTSGSRDDDEVTSQMKPSSSTAAETKQQE